MDRQATLGFVLIFLVLLVWMWTSAPQPEQQTGKQSADSITDTTGENRAYAEKVDVRKSPSVEVDYGKFFNVRTIGTEKILLLETDLFKLELSSYGGLIRKYELKEFNTWEGNPVQLVNYSKGGDFSLLFVSTDGRIINTRNLHFDAAYQPWQKITLEGVEEFRIDFVLPSSNGGKIVKTLKFKNGEYGFTADFRFENLGQVIANYEYQVVWETGLRYAEFNSVDESRSAAAYAYAGGELTELDEPRFDEQTKKELTGSIDWISLRNKYFALAFIPKKNESEGAFLSGLSTALPDKGVYESYNIALRMPFKGNSLEQSSIDVFFGPMEYNILKSYDKNLEMMMRLGWAWIIRPISAYIILPLFKFLNLFIANWGLVLILFSVLVKVALHPLSKTQMKSMRKMQALQPMMEEIKVKHKEDPKKMNQQIMNLYKEYGVNPAGGCLPLLLQFPILIALYNVFISAIELRQAPFVWWITDLSVPDRILTLPFEIPLFGIHDVSGLALLMGITMFIQQKMTIKDPRQKMMIWLMPIMLTLLFNGFPAGLNLYYFFFNLMGIGQQIFVNKQHENEPLRKVEQKKKAHGGIFGKYTKDLPRFKK